MKKIIIYINGHPSVGKFTVAKQLKSYFERCRIIDNHLLIDPISSILERGTSEYNIQRKNLRQSFFKIVYDTFYNKDDVLIFTDSQSTSSLGSSVCREYEQFSKNMNRIFIPIILKCEKNINIERIENRKSSKTKLTSSKILENLIDNEEIFKFNTIFEKIIDNTNLSPNDCAYEIYNHTLNILNNNKNNVECIKSDIKNIFIKDLINFNNENIVIKGWIKKNSKHKNIDFYKLYDSTGNVSLTVDDKKYRFISNFSMVTVYGLLKNKEIIVSDIIVDSLNKSNISLHSFSNSLKYRHLELKTEKLSKNMEFRSEMLFKIRKWFYNNSYIDFSAPIITPSILYEDKTAIGMRLKGKDQKLYLSQCAGFYLDLGATIHEKVYNLGPSFRNESKSSRHLHEYWHIKAELSYGNLDDIINIVENFINDIILECKKIGYDIVGNKYPQLQKTPFQRITYSEAINILKSKNEKINFGDNININHEKILTSLYDNKFLWITHKPKQLEPFPYRLYENDKNLTKTADLISPNGYGEICGVAEKIGDIDEFIERLTEKEKNNIEQYNWIKEFKKFGCTNHIAFGMGFERFMRWILSIEHVKDTIPFPRIYGKSKIYS